ncbi:metallophosphoesterase [Ideonella margarita]|uniref:Metallophosphoesterase n=1 Tax=Ideonella margarita TaxID=2984191 RepID=A0ABU9C775_9BURK
MARTFGSNIPPDQRRRVAWYAPGVLWQAGRELVQSVDFQRNLDRRETLSPVLTPVDLSAQPASVEQPFWFDFMSDTGDGGNATFTVAQALLARELTVPDDNGQMRTLPEGELLVLGGDLAYPGASAQEYQYRFIEMLAMARDPASRFVDPDQPGPRKTLVAIPQNHDWFDSASTFCRYFVNYDRGAVIGARTPQRQTWFATRLPQGFWILGLDFALVGDIDRQQLEGFASLLATDNPAGIQPGDDVLVVYPEPYWTRPLGDGASPGYPRRYQRLEAMIEARGARLRARIAGDLHHYQRETLARDPATGLDTHLITCGSGGAFLHPTHSPDVQTTKQLDREPEPQASSADLGQRVRVGRPGAGAHTASPHNPRFEHACSFPPPARTRALAWRALWSMFALRPSRPVWQLGVSQTLREAWDSNLGFALCLGLLYGFNAYVTAANFHASLAAVAAPGLWDAALHWLKAIVVSPFAAFINAAMLTACVRVAWEGPGTWPGRLASGLALGAVHSFAIFLLFLGAEHAVNALWPGALAAADPLVSMGAALTTWWLVALAGMGVGGLIFGAWLALASGVFGQLPNNAFGALAIADHKGFLRCRLGPDGLEVFMLGIDSVPRRRHADEPVPAGWRVVDRFLITKRAR